LSQDRIDQLESIGFVWRFEGDKKNNKQIRNDNTWKNVFERLVVYKDQHGDCNVPAKYNDGDSPHLGHWVSFQRQCHKRGVLNQDRIDQLEQLGFVWRFEGGKKTNKQINNHDRWKNVFERLMVYKDQHGDCTVPMRYNDGGSPHLGSWVYFQRQSYKSGVLSQDRIDRLEQLGLVLKFEGGKKSNKQIRNDGRWKNVFERLVVYKDQHGDCNVPAKYNDGDSPHLGHWVNSQRRFYKIGVLNQDRIDQLKSIGFVWKMSLV
jgi:hypothetical protein